MLAPGFIDIHTHSDFTLPLNPLAEAKVRQGVTTEVVGNCGFSVAPALPGKAELLADYLSASAPWLPFAETDFASYMAAWPAIAVNTVMQVGHNTLRLMAMGMENRAPNSSELLQMQEMLAEALEAGALGMSSGLFTPPGLYAEPEEIRALGRVLKHYGARYSSHIRDESHTVSEAVAEAIDIGESCGIHVQIAHLKLSGIDSWGGAEKLLGMVMRPVRAGSMWIATSIPTIRPPILCVFCCRHGYTRAGWMRCWRGSPIPIPAPGSVRSSPKSASRIWPARILGGHPYCNVTHRGSRQDNRGARTRARPGSPRRRL